MLRGFQGAWFVASSFFIHVLLDEHEGGFWTSCATICRGSRCRQVRDWFSLFRNSCGSELAARLGARPAARVVAHAVLDDFFPPENLASGDWLQSLWGLLLFPIVDLIL